MKYVNLFNFNTICYLPCCLKFPLIWGYDYIKYQYLHLYVFYKCFMIHWVLFFLNWIKHHAITVFGYSLYNLEEQLIFKTIHIIQLGFYRKYLWCFKCFDKKIIQSMEKLLNWISLVIKKICLRFGIKYLIKWSISEEYICSIKKEAILYKQKQTPWNLNYSKSCSYLWTYNRRIQKLFNWSIDIYGKYQYIFLFYICFLLLKFEKCNKHL